MSYHGYISYVKSFLSQIQRPPRVLEIGVDNGVSFLTLSQFLKETFDEFVIVGVDVLVKEHVKLMVHLMNLKTEQRALLYENNSLDIIPVMVERELKYDLILIDGDHNFHTVEKELSYIDSLLTENGIVIIDDYSGRWADRDMWYSERDTHSGIGTKRQETEKHGVKAAVDEFVLENPSWKISTLIENGEPVVLERI